MGLKSRASGRANFLPGTSREEAWQIFAGMFNQGKSPLIGTAGGWLDTVRSQSDGAGLDVGDEFRAHSHADKYHLRITGCSSPDYLAYEINGELAGVLKRRATKGRANTGYFGQWTSLPIDYASVIVR